MSSRNALYVLRLIWRDRPTPGSQALDARRKTDRSFVTAAVGKESTDGHFTFFSELTRSHPQVATNATQTGSIDFLENDSVEYTSALATLPDRDPTPRPIPWPTLFPHDSPSNITSTDRTERVHRSNLLSTQRTKRTYARSCDTLARMVEAKNYVSARTVFTELRSLNVPIQSRAVYLSAALASLDQNDKEGFLFWLELYPNRPATGNHPALKRTWEPVVRVLMQDHTADLGFLEGFLGVAARKGFLTAVLDPLISHLSLIATPSTSRRVLQETIDGYISATSSSTSTSVRAKTHLQAGRVHVERWWHIYLRSLTLSGWNNDARELLNNPPTGIIWDAFTQQFVQEELEAPRGTHGKSYEAGEESWMSKQVVPTLEERMEIALQPDTTPSPNRLAVLIERLERSLPSSVSGFRRRFCHPPGTHAGRTVPTVREQIWSHAIMIIHSRRSEHQLVIDTFRSRFLWYGIPGHPLQPRRASRTSDSRSTASDISGRDTRRRASPHLIHPSKQILTTLIPSLLATLPTTALIAFHQSYLSLSHTLPPVLNADPHIHLTFIRAITHRLGPDIAVDALNQIMEHGYDPGLSAWTTLLLSLAGRGRFEEMFELLEGMRVGAIVGQERNGWTGPLPRPEVKTYTWVEGVVRKKGEEVMATRLRGMRDEAVKSREAARVQMEAVREEEDRLGPSQRPGVVENDDGLETQRDWQEMTEEEVLVPLRAKA